MTEFQLKIPCEICTGTGLVIEVGIGETAQEVQCTNCNGTGYEMQGVIDCGDVLTDMQDIINDIQDKVNDIQERIS